MEGLIDLDAGLPAFVAPDGPHTFGLNASDCIAYATFWLVNLGIAAWDCVKKSSDPCEALQHPASRYPGMPGMGMGMPGVGQDTA